MEKLCSESSYISVFFSIIHFFEDRPSLKQKASIIGIALRFWITISPWCFTDPWKLVRMP